MSNSEEVILYFLLWKYDIFMDYIKNITLYNTFFFFTMYISISCGPSNVRNICLSGKRFSTAIVDNVDNIFLNIYMYIQEIDHNFNKI